MENGGIVVIAGEGQLGAGIVPPSLGERHGDTRGALLRTANVRGLAAGASSVTQRPKVPRLSSARLTSVQAPLASQRPRMPPHSFRPGIERGQAGEVLRHVASSQNVLAHGFRRVGWGRAWDNNGSRGNLSSETALGRTARNWCRLSEFGLNGICRVEPEAHCDDWEGALEAKTRWRPCLH